jgi:putative ATPase
MKDLGYGKDYQYAHDEPDAITNMSCLPPALEGHRYYEPTERGFENEIARRMRHAEQIRRGEKREP